MARLGRPGMSDERKDELWQRWHSGESISQIGRAMGKPPGSVYTILRTGGGVYTPPRRRRADHLSLREREEISRGLARGETQKAIAERLGRAPSTISREIRRNKGRSNYRAIDAHDRAWYRAQRPKACLLQLNPLLAEFVANMLAEGWSPEQISGFLRVWHAGNAEMQISHETIYKTLFIGSRTVLPRKLTMHLRTRRPLRKHKKNTVKGQLRSQIAGAVSIHERPKEVEARSSAGHWEGDLVLGGGVTQIATLVERASRFAVLVQLDGRDMVTVAGRLVEEIDRLPAAAIKTITWDRGMELARHATITERTGVDVYFADARSPWQRATNENTNGLVRQYLPKGSSFATLTQDQLDHIAARLNNRPRKSLGYQTPAKVLEAMLR